jgi:hypothetical protein
VMTMLNSFQGSGEFAADSPVQAKSEHVRDLSAERRNSPRSQERSKSLWMGKFRRKLKLGSIRPAAVSNGG